MSRMRAIKKVVNNRKSYDTVTIGRPRGRKMGYVEQLNRLKEYTGQQFTYGKWRILGGGHKDFWSLPSAMRKKIDKCAGSSDCGVVALLNHNLGKKGYQDVFKDFTKFGLHNENKYPLGTVKRKQRTAELFNFYGFQNVYTKPMRDDDTGIMTLIDTAKRWPNSVVRVKGHYAAVKDGRLMDSNLFESVSGDPNPIPNNEYFGRYAEPLSVFARIER